jgi:8-oxo-dGTP pyrophosphatase MutT (NUDIX family)
LARRQRTLSFGELQEELGITVSDLPVEPIEHVETDEFNMQVWVITDWWGTPTNLAPDEHAVLAWFSLEQIPDLRLAQDIYPPSISKMVSVPPTQP